MLSIKNFTKNKINEKFLRLAEKEAIKNIPELRKKPKMEIDLAIIGEKRMKRLNRIWRGKDRATDVLSFESAGGRTKEHSLKKWFKFIFPPDGDLHLGDILICYPVVEREAMEDGFSIDKEMAILLIHGILHLAGYDHEKNAIEAKKMFGLQERITEKVLGKSPNKRKRHSVYSLFVLLYMGYNLVI